MMRSILKWYFILTIFVIIFTTHSSAAMTVVNLTCENCVNPIGVDNVNPVLSWALESNKRGAKQTAYQILAATSEKILAGDEGDLWDSGKIDSNETVQIGYCGKKLSSFQQVFWKVRVWDENSIISHWSAPTTWTMAVLQNCDWHAQWIGAKDTNISSLLLRHEFFVGPNLKRALLNICGLGEYEFTVNGKKITDDFLTPGWTKYDKTCLYDSWDITKYLIRGKNATGIELGDGMYRVLKTRFKPPGWSPYSFGPQKAIAQIRLEYSDGSVGFIGTDKDWTTSAGPIMTSSIYSGEDYDARRAQPGWNKINFDDSKWAAAQIENGPGGELRGLSIAAPPICFFETHKPVSLRVVTNGDVIFDLGQNAAHVPQISVAGPAGSRVRVIPSELGDGMVNGGSMGEHPHSAIWCDYIKGTDGVETWSPKFFYIGCRYLEVKSFPAQSKAKLPVVKSIVGRVVQCSSRPVGEFQCSNKLFNRIRTLVRWAQRSNMMSVMTDCPQREKRGWLEEDHLNGPALRYEFDMAQLFAKIMNDIADSQVANGLVPTTAPEYALFGAKKYTDNFRGQFGDSPEWGSAFILVPWQQYEFDGDLNLLRAYYGAMKKYLNYYSSRAKSNIVDYGLGDWYDIGPKHPGIAQLTPIAFTATAFYFQDAKILARIAHLLGQDEDAESYSKLAEAIRVAFNEKFYYATKHCYATDSQTANSIALAMEICEPTNRADVLDAIVQDVRKRCNALTAGDIGYRYLLRALAEGGRSDVIFDINNQSDKPGYGMQLKKGATSLTEAWDGGRDSSQNHFMLGQIQEWFYHDLAGIQNAPGSAGFREIVIAPQPVGDISWARATFNSIRGNIVCDWKRDNGKFIIKVTIPANTTATVFLPAQVGEMVLENGSPASQSLGVKFVREENGYEVYKIESGSYKFEVVH